MPKKISGKTINDQLATSFVTMTANLQRLSASESLVIVGILKELEMDIVTKLQDNPDMSQWRKSRYEALLSQTRDTIKTSYTKIADHGQEYLEQVGTVASNGSAKIFQGVGVPLESVVVTEEQLAAIAKNSLINGSPAKAWWAKQSKSLQDSFSQQMKIGYASGETVDQLVQRVRGRATGKKNSYIINGKKKIYTEFSGGIMDTGTRQAEALVRTATQQIAADAKMEMFRKNADILKGVMWLATLDSRTTPLCRAHDGLLYDLDGNPIGHKVSFMAGPPAHWNCRSTLVPVTKSFEELGATPGVTQEYLNQIGEGTRASMNGQVPAALTFDSWFNQLPEADQIAFLGPKRFQIWKDAGLNFADMIDQRGNPLTIQQLAEAYGVKIKESAISGIPNIPQKMATAIVVEQEAQILASQMVKEAAEASAAQAAEAQAKLKKLLEDPGYAAAFQEVKVGGEAPLSDSELLKATEEKYKQLTADAKKKLAAAAKATGQAEQAAWNVLENLTSGKKMTALAKWEKYQSLLASLQQDLAKTGLQAIEETIGSHQLDGSILTVGNKKFDVLDPQGLTDFKKYKSMHLSKYKQAVLAGKPISPAHQVIYDHLSFAEKEAFDDSLAKALSKKTTPPVTSNAVPEPGALQFSQMEKIGEQRGSNVGGFFRDRRTGVEYYVKFPASEDIARNELLAAKLYEAAGVDVPELTLINDGSRVGIASKVKPGLSTGTAAKLSKAIGAADNYAVDAWLANWDVVGLNYDNLLLTDAGTAFRVDVGGSLRYRAQGGLKGNLFGKAVDELDSLRSAKINRQSAAVFGKLSTEDLEAGVRKVLGLSDDKIRELVKLYGPLDEAVGQELADTLIARKQYLANKFPHLVQGSPVLSPAGSAQLVSPAEIEAIKNARINGYALPADADKIEDQSILAWFEKDEKGNSYSGLRFKFTQAAEKAVAARIHAGSDIALKEEYDALKAKIGKWWKEIYSASGATISETQKNRYLKFENKYWDFLIKLQMQHSPFASQFEQIAGQAINDLRKVFTSGEYKPVGVIAESRFAKSAINKLQFVGESKPAGSFIFEKVKATFYASRIENGFAVRTDELLFRGGRWMECYQATAQDGTRVRIWLRDIGGQALMNQVEILTPGATEQSVNRAMQLIEKELGIKVSLPTAPDQQEMYLRMIARHRGEWSLLDQADAMRAKGSPSIEIGSFLKSGLSGTSGDITKLAGYNPQGIYEAFDSGFRRWYLPEVDTDPGWASFQKDYVLYHQITNGSLAESLDRVLNSGGKMIPTANRMRYGIPWGGWSPEKDMQKGGADYFFTRIFNRDSKQIAGSSLIFNSRQAARLDAVSRTHDAFGITTNNMIRIDSEHGVAALKACARHELNETMFKGGMSIFDQLEYINCASVEEARAVRGILAKHGWSTYWADGRKMQDLIRVGNKPVPEIWE